VEDDADLDDNNCLTVDIRVVGKSIVSVSAFRFHFDVSIFVYCDDAEKGLSVSRKDLTINPDIYLYANEKYDWNTVEPIIIPRFSQLLFTSLP
jgi:hypothetical protein